MAEAMSDHLDRLTAWVTRDTVDRPLRDRLPVSHIGAPLNRSDLRAALDELKQLRAERDGKPETRCPVLSTTRLRLQCSRPEGHDAAHVAELDGMGRFSWHGGAPQHPEDGDRG